MSFRFINWKPFNIDRFNFFGNNEGPGPQPILEPFYIKNITTANVEVYWGDPQRIGGDMGLVEASYNGDTWFEMEMGEGETLRPNAVLYMRAPNGTNIQKKQIPLLMCNVDNALEVGGDFSLMAGSGDWSAAYMFQRYSPGRRGISDLSKLDFKNITYAESQFRYAFSTQSYNKTIPQNITSGHSNIPKYCFYMAFYNNGITELPSDLFTFESGTTFDRGCFNGMFAGCLVENIPEIKANELEESIFEYIFENNTACRIHKTDSRVCAEQYHGCTNFEELWLTNTAFQPLSDVNAFQGTKITATSGTIHVPNNLLQQYKTATNWSTFANRIVGY